MPKEFFNKKIPLWLGILTQIIVIITFIAGIIYYPIRKNFNDVYAKIAVMERDHKRHCEDQKERMKQFASIDTTNVKLEQICKDLGRLFDAIDKCQEEDAKFRDTLYNFINTFPEKR